MQGLSADDLKTLGGDLSAAGIKVNSDGMLASDLTDLQRAYFGNVYSQFGGDTTFEAFMKNGGGSLNGKFDVPNTQYKGKTLSELMDLVTSGKLTMAQVDAATVSGGHLGGTSIQTLSGVPASGDAGSTGSAGAGGGGTASVHVTVGVDPQNNTVKVTGVTANGGATTDPNLPQTGNPRPPDNPASHTASTAR
jgi:hypothetical protein